MISLIPVVAAVAIAVASGSRVDAAKSLPVHARHRKLLKGPPRRRRANGPELEDAAHAQAVRTRSVVISDLDPAEASRRLNRRVVSAVAGLGVATLGTFWAPPLAIWSLPFLAHALAPILSDGYHAIRERRLNMATVDTLLMAGFVATGQLLALGVFGFFLTVCSKLLNWAEDRSQRKLVGVFGDHRKTVWVVVDGVEVQIPFGSLAKGDRLIARAGDSLVADGTVVAGAGTVNESLLTGEARPAEKAIGDRVYAATTVLTGTLHIVAERSGAETTAGQIAEALNRTADYRQHLQWRWLKIIDRMAAPTLASGAVGFVTLGPAAAVPLMLAVSEFGYGMRVLAPFQLFRFLREAFVSAILVKDGRVFERVQEIDTVVFDKTGTLTEERPHVGAIHHFGDVPERDILYLAASVEQRQSHPIAMAILDEAQRRGIALSALKDGQVQLGLGLKAVVGNRTVALGSARFMAMEGIALPSEAADLLEDSRDVGHSLVWVAADQAIVGAIELEPSIRPEAESVIRALRARGLAIHILSGDHERPTRHLAALLGVNGCFAQVLPDGKASVVQELQAQGRRVCFVGDGVNDSLALKQADVSVSLRGATTIATDTAQVVLTEQSLSRLPDLFNLAGSFQANMGTSFRLSVAPSVAATVGVVMFHIGLIPVIVLTTLGLGVGVAQATLPMLQGPSNRNAHRMTGHSGSCETEGGRSE